MSLVKAKKHLGQHFLKDENIAFRIADSLTPGTQQVLEVGPGTGVLTKYLLKKNYSKFVAVEIDRESASFLRTNYPMLEQNLIENDFLKMDIEGAELSAINGAKNIINQYHPKLAICVYHRAADIREIFKTVLNIRADYHVYLRHYTEGIYETVMYFIPFTDGEFI